MPSRPNLTWNIPLARFVAARNATLPGNYRKVTGWRVATIVASIISIRD